MEDVKACNMEKRLFIYIVLLLIGFQMSAQQTVQYRYQVFDDYLLNPAYVGSMDYYPINVGRDQRFYGLNGKSPETYYLSLHSRVGEGFIFAKDGKVNQFFDKFGNMALGLQLFQYKYGPTRETNIGLTYGYHLDLNQNVKRKNQRKLVLALTPRLKRLGVVYEDLLLQNSPLDGSSHGANLVDPALGDLDHLRSWMFTADVGALYKSIHGEFGIGSVDVFRTRNRIESDFIYYNDSIVEDPYNFMYPTKLFANMKLTFIEMYKSSTFDVNFVPTVSALYGPKNNSSEFFVDLMLQCMFKEHIAGIRSELVFTGELGLNIMHTRVFEPTTLFQPYCTFDFKNMMVTYAQTLIVDSDLIGTDGVFGGGQISVILKIGKDRTIRTIRGNNSWYK